MVGEERQLELGWERRVETARVKAVAGVTNEIPWRLHVVEEVMYR
jgi:hypothetical protein